MKLICFFTLFFISLVTSAQDCSTSLLFKKGSELEYKSYAPKAGIFGGNKFFEMTRLLFTVDDVKDSNHVTYSYITKKGVAANNEKDAYTKKYVLSCDGSIVTVPFDFYSSDTSYLCDIYPKVQNKGYYAATTYKGKSFYHFPVNFEKDKFELTGNKLTMDMTIRDYESDNTNMIGGTEFGTKGPSASAKIAESKFSMDISIKKTETKGKEKITTPAGTYECYKLLLTMDASMFGRGVDMVSAMYYDPGVGFIKSETQQSKNKTGYTELVRVKK
jgi:hypothetical protein